MSKSMDQVESLVSKAVRSAKSDRELSIKGLNFGRWWNEVGEYKKASVWITRYLVIYDKDAKAHKLLGELYEKLDNNNAALACYKSSLRVKPQQYELMLKLVEMYINPGSTQNPSRAQVWLDKAAVALPNNPQVYKLKMELFLAQEASPSKLEGAILDELRKRPSDPSLYVQYVTFLKDKERHGEAFAFLQKTDRSGSLPDVVEKDMEWNQCLIETCQEYSERVCENQVTPEGIKAFSLLLLSVSRFVLLCFEQEKYDEAMNRLALLDQSVLEGLELNYDASEVDGLEWASILNEAKGQLYWLSAIALLHLAMQSVISWREATRLSAACYAVSLSYPMADTSATWASWSKDGGLSERLKAMSGFRLSQSAHMVYNLASTSHTDHEEENEINEKEWIREVTDNYCTDEGKRKVFENLFGERCDTERSMIYSNAEFCNVSAQLVSEVLLLEYDLVAVSQADLQTWIWMGLQWKQNFDNSFDPFSWISSVFSELQFAPSSSAKYGNVWNLFRLDVEAFIVACVLYAEKAVTIWRGSRQVSEHTSLGISRLPLPLCRKLITERQCSWWQAACKLHNKRNKEKISNSIQVRATLRHGIEAIRGSGNHGLQLIFITGLGKHFAAKAYTIDKSGMGTSSAPWLAYQRRSAHYWTLALPLLQNVTTNRSRLQIEPKDRLFPKILNEITVQEARGLISEVYMCHGSLLVQEGDLMRALATYGKADTPHASFCEALIYKQLLENCEKEFCVASSSDKKTEALLRKYTARLEVTLNRLQQDPDEELLHKTEALLHNHMSPTVNHAARTETDPKRLFEETIPQHLPYVANHTVNSEVDDSVLPVIPSKQSTPKSEMKSIEYGQERSNMLQLTHNLTALTSALSTMQLQFNERLSRMEKDKTPELATEEKTDTNLLENVCNQLAKLTTIVTGLQDDTTSQQTQMQKRLKELQDQVDRSQLGSPVAPGHAVQYSHLDEKVPPQVFDDQYHHRSMGQMGSPAQPASHYGAFPYNTFAQQNPAIASLYAQQGYALPGDMAQYNRMQQQIIGARVMPSPAHTPPINSHQQQLTTNAGLAISKEGFDALSVRFQSSIVSGVSSADPARPVIGASPRLSGTMQGQQSSRHTMPQLGTVHHDQLTGYAPLGSSASDINVMGRQSPFRTGMMPENPLGSSMSQPTMQQQVYQRDGRSPFRGSVPQAYSETVIGSEPSYNKGPSYGMVQPPINDMQRRFLDSNYQSHEVDTQQRKSTLDESYLPPSVSNTQVGEGPNILRNLLAAGSGDSQVPSSTRQPEINYPTHIQFPDKKDQNIASPGWDFKFQSPEEMDRDNKKLEADEEAEDAETSHNDVGPHFEPLVNLPEVEVRTGEEEEEIIFSEKAKLFRWHEVQWKDRGVGEMKILKHNVTGKYRLLMRRDQVLKICCNHLIGKELELKPMPKSDKAWVWHAMDFSDKESKQEGFAIRFKTAEMANDFKKKFLEGQEANIKLSGDSPTRSSAKNQSGNIPVNTIVASSGISTPTAEAKSSFSGTTKPKFKFAFPKPSGAALDLAAKIYGTPFKLAVEHTKQHEAENQDEDIHNESVDGPHFEPVIQLPDKINVVTGEEDEEILFCQRVKLYRYVDNQWKERGVGDMKILHNKSSNKCRIVMRREQILKLCANHYITPEMKLGRHGNQDKALTWTAMDHSDPDAPPQQELLAARFKEVETAVKFKEVFIQAKKIVQETVTASPLSSTATASATKPIAVSVSSTGTFKLPTFSTSTATTTVQETPVQQKIQSQTIDSTSKGTLLAKKAAGAWSCSGCSAQNPATAMKCKCCETPNPTAPKAEASLATKPSLSFSFGMPAKPSGFSFGIPPSQVSSSNQSSSDASKVVFGIGQSQKTDKSPEKPGLFNLAQAEKGAFSFGSTTGNNAVIQTKSVFGVSSQSVKTVEQPRPLTVTKQKGQWNCPSCYASNGPEITACLCCQAPNPSAPPGAKAEKSAGKPGLFNLAQSESGASSVSTTAVSSSDPAMQTKSVFGVSSSQSVEQPSPFTVTKQKGQWNCPTCYVSNGPEVAACPCCQTPNPSAPPGAKVASGLLEPGLFDLISVQKSSFSFGIPSKSTPAESQETQKDVKVSGSVVSPPKFIFGKSGGTTFTFGVPQSVDSEKKNLFGSNSQSTTAIDRPKPRFPSVEVDDDEDEDDSVDDDDDDEYTDASTGSSYQSSEDDDDDYYQQNNRKDFRSPLNRPEQPDANQDDDVVCTGEVLPTKELQKKAEDLMLPKHFYNFIKEGEEESQGSETGDEQLNSGDKKTPENEVVVSSSTKSATIAPSTFGFAAASGASFADLVKSNTKSEPAFGGGAGGWVGMTDQTPLFGNLSKPDSTQGNEYYQSEENIDIHFEPIAKLPEKVDVITGEEDEESLHSQRCKLYRYNKPTNEWKERGVGDIKLLRNLNNGRVRVVMRREQVLKVCANHYIRPGMSLEGSKTSDKAWTWTAMDFTEDEPKMEIFTVKFKTADMATEFKEKFDACLLMLLDVDPLTPCKASALRTKDLSDKAEKMKNELRYFKDKFSEPTKIDLENTITDDSSPTEPRPPPAMGSLTPLVVQHTQNLRKLASEQSAENVLNITPVKPILDWKKTTEKESEKVSSSQTMTDKKEASFTPQGRQYTISAGSDDPQAEADVHFEPVIQLPEQVDLATGEEDEQVIFGNRGKLFAFHKETKQWKERGVGDVKILQNLTTYKVRVLMRREQVFKVCLNHFVQPEIVLKFKESTASRTLLWSAKDFSDTEKPDGEDLQFALRFNDQDTANSFKELWSEGAVAAVSKTLLDPDLSLINTSALRSGVTSPCPVKSPQSPESPVKQPLSTFSFSNVPSPFDASKKSASEGPVNVMGFVFGKTPDKPDTGSTTPTTGKFNFDVSKLSFNFGTTSTPQKGAVGTPTGGFFTPPQNLPASKAAASKSLFSGEASDSNLYLTSSDTFTQPDQSTVMSDDPNSTAQTIQTVSSLQPVSIISSGAKGYTPSPLVASNLSAAGKAFSVQSGARFQFKPVTTEGSQKNEGMEKGKVVDDDDVIFVWEATPTEEQRQRAEILHLPLTFFLFENEITQKDFNDKIEDEKEDKILQYIADRDSGSLKAKSNYTEVLVLDNTTSLKESINTESASDGSQQESTENKWIFGGGSQNQPTNSGFASFATMASGVQNVGFKIDPSFQFPGAGQVMFQSQTADNNEDPASFKCEVQFKPVLDELPPLIEIKTGEEGEEILFKERCKLYRYDKETKQWKERGSGEVKILFNDQHNIYRVLMRRDQIHKVCANHVINKTTIPEPHLGSLKTCSYFALDYSESESPIGERFAVRFKTEELCKAYVDKINDVKLLII